MLVSIQFLLFLFRNQVIIFGVIGTSCWPNQFPNKLNKDFQVLPFYILVTHPIYTWAAYFVGESGGWVQKIRHSAIFWSVLQSRSCCLENSECSGEHSKLQKKECTRLHSSAFWWFQCYKESIKNKKWWKGRMGERGHIPCPCIIPQHVWQNCATHE